jgi:hypothetical protein
VLDSAHPCDVLDAALPHHALDGVEPSLMRARRRPRHRVLNGALRDACSAEAPHHVLDGALLRHVLGSGSRLLNLPALLWFYSGAAILNLPAGGASCDAIREREAYRQREVVWL